MTQRDRDPVWPPQGGDLAQVVVGALCLSLLILATPHVFERDSTFAVVGVVVFNALYWSGFILKYTFERYQVGLAGEFGHRTWRHCASEFLGRVTILGLVVVPIGGALWLAGASYWVVVSIGCTGAWILVDFYIYPSPFELRESE